jgi:hypothetical protein
VRRLTGLLLLLACAHAPPPAPVAPALPAPPPVAAPKVDPARDTIDRFLAAARGGRFEEALALLARPLRERYGAAERLAADFKAEPLAGERLEQLARTSAPAIVAGDTASLEWSPGRRLRLVREPDGWRVAALE